MWEGIKRNLLNGPRGARRFEPPCSPCRPKTEGGEGGVGEVNTIFSPKQISVINHPVNRGDFPFGNVTLHTQIGRLSPSQTRRSQRVRTAPHCATLHLTIKHCNIHSTVKSGDCHHLKPAAPDGSVLQHTATHSKTLQHTAPRCATLHHTALQQNTPQRTATCCSTL